jgi:heme/copper-type cytochrome/quinol oxidase subunit 3
MTTEIDEPLLEQQEVEENPVEQIEKEKRNKRFSAYNFFTANVLFFVMLFAFALLYIRNAHYSENLVRTIDRTKHEVREIRWEYMTAKAVLMSASKQTEVAKVVESQGLKELSNPPKKIKVKPE